MKLNPLTACDFYKVGHRPQYPQGITEVYSNFTPRSDALAKTKGGIVFAGLSGFIQWFLIDCWNENFFNRPKEEVDGLTKDQLINFQGNQMQPVFINGLHLNKPTLEQIRQKVDASINKELV